MVESSLVHHFHNRHDGFMQPELVENHHLDFKFPDNGISKFWMRKITLRFQIISGWNFLCF